MQISESLASFDQEYCIEQRFWGSEFTQEFPHLKMFSFR